MLPMNKSTEHPSGVAQTYKKEASDLDERWTWIWYDLKRLKVLQYMDCANWRTQCIYKCHQVTSASSSDPIIGSGGWEPEPERELF